MSLQSIMVQHEARQLEKRLPSACSECKARAGELCRHDFHTNEHPAHRLVPHDKREVVPMCLQCGTTQYVKAGPKNLCRAGVYGGPVGYCEVTA